MSEPALQVTPSPYVPGSWHCAKCKFTLQQMSLHASTGQVTANDKPGEKCPNCDSPLWRRTWEQDAREAWAKVEDLLTWKPIELAEHDGREYIVGVDIAGDWIVRAAHWSNGDTTPGFEHARGWWSNVHSVSQDLLEGIYAPTHFLERPRPPRG